MKALQRFYQSFLLTRRTYAIMAVIALMYVASFWLPSLYMLATVAIYVLMGTVLMDAIVMYAKREGITARRQLTERFSNGDDNPVTLHIGNHYSFTVNCEVIDELPVQFQQHNWLRRAVLRAGQGWELNYMLRPLQRGEYHFGVINISVTSPLQLVKRRFICGEPQTIACYPSFHQLKRFQLVAVASHFNESGNRRLRKMGNSMEFEQIKEYVTGDDYRNVNWKATARRGDLMVNTFTDEKSQHIYCIIDKGRNMKMPFEGITLLDYAINASLALSNVALLRQDKVGLLSFAARTETFVAADKKSVQMELLLENLYRQQTNFTESDFEALYAQIRNRIKNRSLLIMFTNFESVHSFQRQLPYLKQIARHHLLLLIFFENTELKSLRDNPAKDLEGIYIKTIADRFAYEKRLIVKELQQHGILSLLTAPENVTISAINKYIELKARQAM